MKLRISTISENTIRLMILSALFVITTLLEPLSIMISGPSITDRGEISYALTIYIMCPAIFLLFTLSFAETKAIFKKKELIKTLPMFLFVELYLISFVIHGEWPGIQKIIFFPGLFMSGYFFFSKLRKFENTSIFLHTYWLMSTLVVFSGYYFFVNDMLTYWPAPLWGILRPQVGMLLRSTEASNIIACILMFAPVAWANSKSVWGKLAVIIATLPMLFLFVLMGSLGSIIIMVLLIVIFFPAKLYVIKALYIALLLFTILSIYALINQNIANQLYQNAADIHQNWEDKMEYDGRNKIFTELIDMIVEKPFIGYGAYSFYKKTDFWPHNNILGIWVDHGMLVVAAYIFFLCITIYYCLIVRKIHLQKIPQDMLTKLAVSFAMMSIFLHGKGFVHDTWYTLGLWLYSGCLFGLLSNPDLLQQKYRSRINNNHHLSHSLIGRDVRLITKIKT